MSTFNQYDVIPYTFMNAIERENLEEENAVAYNVPITQWRYSDGDAVNATGGSGDPQLVMGGWGSGDGLLRGQDAHGTTKTEYVVIDYPIRENIVSGEAFTFTIKARVYDTGSGSYVQKTLDIEAHQVDLAGESQGDLCTTAAKTLTTTMAEYSFTITNSMNVGETLRVIVKGVIQESGGSGAQKLEIGGAVLKQDIKG